MTSPPPPSHPLLDPLSEDERERALALIYDEVARTSSSPMALLPLKRGEGGEAVIDFAWPSLDAPAPEPEPLPLGPSEAPEVAAFFDELNRSQQWRAGGDDSVIEQELEWEREKVREGIELMRTSGRHWYAAAMTAEAKRIEEQRAEAARQLAEALRAMREERAAVEARCDEIQRHIDELGG